MPTVKNTEASREKSGQAPTLQKASGSAWTLWLWVGAAFLLLVLAWSVLFTVARSAKVESVPLAAKEAKS
jgi:hypothetical protein